MSVSLNNTNLVKNSSTIPTLKETLLFSVPQLALMLCHLCISITDVWVTGKLGSSAQAALGIVSQINIIFMLVVSFFSSGFTSTITQCLGAKKELRASRYVVSLILICIIATSFIASLSYLLSDFFVNNYTSQNTKLHEIVSIFIVAYCCNLPCYYLMVMINSIFRAYKKTTIPCQTIFIVCTINFIASLGFGTGAFGFPDYSYAGVAWSTTLSGIIGCLYNLFHLYRSKIIVTSSMPALRWLKKALPYVFRIGIPSVIASVLSQSASVIIMFIILSFPSTTDFLIAGLTLGTRIQSIALFIISAISVSVTILVGHLMGARNFIAIYQFGNKMMRFCFYVALLLSACIYLFQDAIILNFTSDDNVIKETAYFISFACLMLPFMGINAVLGGIFMGVGASKLNMLVAMLTAWLIQIPTAYFLGAYLQLGVLPVYCSYVFCSLLSSVILMYLFRKRKWEQYGLFKTTSTATFNKNLKRTLILNK